MEQTQSPDEFLVQRRSVVRVMAWLYDRSKLKHIEILFILQVISHPGSKELSNSLTLMKRGWGRRLARMDSQF